MLIDFKLFCGLFIFLTVAPSDDKWRLWTWRSRTQRFWM